MKRYTFDDMRELVLDIIETKIVLAGLDRKKIPNEIDLLMTGIIDSFDFIDMICAVEDSTGLTVDLSQVDNKSFTTLEGFVKEILS